MLFKQKTVNNIIFHHLGNPMVLNKTLITGVLILCLVVFSQARAQNNSLFSPVIQVNDTVITKFEFDQRVKSGLGRKGLRSWKLTFSYISESDMWIDNEVSQVRLISPFVRSKENDPAILVMDSKAKNVITLLGGHKQGGDAFANELAAALEAEVICTSDSFTERRIPLDCFGEGWGWKRGGSDVEWRKLMINQSKEQKIIYKKNLKRFRR